MSLFHELSAAVIRNRLHIGRSGTCMHKTIQIIQIYTSNLARAPFSNSPCANAHLHEVSSIPDCLPRDYPNVSAFIPYSQQPIRSRLLPVQIPRLNDTQEGSFCTGGLGR